MSAGRRYRRRLAAGAVDAGPGRLPGWMADQIAAAAAEMAEMTAATAETLTSVHGFRSATVRADPDLRADLFACFLRCRCCPHVYGRGPQPTFVDLSRDVLLCRSCLVGGGLRKPDPANEDRCDLCETHGHEIFTEITLHDGGPIQVHLNVGGCCKDRLGAA